MNNLIVFTQPSCTGRAKFKEKNVILLVPTFSLSAPRERTFVQRNVRYLAKINDRLTNEFQAIRLSSRELLSAADTIIKKR